jgi:hypothetical protein
MEDKYLSLLLRVIVSAFVLFLVLRELNCWYWKINIRIKLMEENNRLLRLLLKQNTSQSLNQEEAPTFNQEAEEPIFSKPSRFKFNYYWVYGLVILAILALVFIDFSTTPRHTNWREFEVNFLQAGDVEHLEVVNKEKVYVYIKKESLNKEEYKSVRYKSSGKSINKGPHYYFEFSDLDTFEEKLHEAQRDLPSDQKVSVIYISTK